MEREYILIRVWDNNNIDNNERCKLQEKVTALENRDMKLVFGYAITTPALAHLHLKLLDRFEARLSNQDETIDIGHRHSAPQRQGELKFEYQSSAQFSTADLRLVAIALKNELREYFGWRYVEAFITTDV